MPKRMESNQSTSKLLLPRLENTGIIWRAFGLSKSTVWRMKSTTYTRTIQIGLLYLVALVCYLLMHDAGVPIQGNYMGFEDFCREYYRLMVSTENIADDAKVIHGDIHRHNILFCAQQNRISLVDWDESTLDEALDREVTQQHNKERYPEKLKEDGKAFTMVQLFICFRDFISDEYDKVLVYASEGNIMGFVDSKSLREEVRIDLTDYNSNSVEKIYRCLENKLREM